MCDSLCLPPPSSNDSFYYLSVAFLHAYPYILHNITKQFKMTEHYQQYISIKWNMASVICIVYCYTPHFFKILMYALIYLGMWTSGVPHCVFWSWRTPYRSWVFSFTKWVLWADHIQIIVLGNKGPKHLSAPLSSSSDSTSGVCGAGLMAFLFPFIPLFTFVNFITVNELLPIPIWIIVN